MQDQEYYFPSMKPKDSPEKKAALYMVLLGAMILGALIQIINWDKYSLTVIPLQAYTLMGNATAQDHSEFARICLERRKPECALEHLKAQTHLDPKNLIAKFELGRLQLKMGDLPSAISTLSAYIEEGGESPHARFQLAKAYAMQNNTGEALKLYTQLLRGKSNVFQVSVTREYIQTLIQAKKWNQAKSSIERARRRSLTHNAFMTAEYKVILNKLRRRNLAGH